jgi:hypothetical protein
VGFLSLSLSLSVSLFSVALSSNGGDWVATTQYEMSSTGGTWRRRASDGREGFEVWMCLRFGLLGRNLVFWFYFLNLFHAELSHFHWWVDNGGFLLQLN